MRSSGLLRFKANLPSRASITAGNGLLFFFLSYFHKCIFYETIITNIDPLSIYYSFELFIQSFLSMSRARLCVGAEPTQYSPLPLVSPSCPALFTRPHKYVRYCLKSLFFWKRSVSVVDLLKLEPGGRICLLL